MTEPLLLTRQQINDTYWNTLIGESTHPVAYAYTWYLDIVTPDWQALILRQNDGYHLVMPLPIKNKWGFRVVQQPFFCQYLGIYARKPPSQSEVKMLFRALHRHFRYISSYAFHPDDSSILDDYLPSDPLLNFHALSTHWLNLDTSYKSLVGGYTPDRKTNQRRAYLGGWKRVESADPAPLIHLFRHYHAISIPGGVAEAAYELLTGLVGMLLQRKVAHLYYALRAGEIHAGILILEHNKSGIYLFNAADATGRAGNARTWLLDTYFQERAGQMEWFDFESPEVDSIRSFYKSFGATERGYYIIQKNKLPFPLRQLQEWRRRWLRAI